MLIKNMIREGAETQQEDVSATSASDLFMRSIWLHIFATGVIACVLTVCEILVLAYSVFPDLKRILNGLLREAKTRFVLPTFVSAIFSTMHDREQVYICRSNEYIWYFCMFFLTIMMICTFFACREVLHLSVKMQMDGFVEIKRSLFFSISTVFLIGMFQGFPCVLFGHTSSMCWSSSFVAVTSKWQFNNDFASVLKTTLRCDSTEETSMSMIEDSIKNMHSYLEQIPSGSVLDTVSKKRGLSDKHVQDAKTSANRVVNLLLSKFLSSV